MQIFHDFVFICFCVAFMKEKIQRARKRATPILPLPASLSLPCAVLCWGGFSVGRFGSSLELQCYKANASSEVGAGPVPEALQSSLQSLAPLCGCLALWGLSTAPGTHVFCLLSLLSPSLWPAVRAACSANDTLPVSHPLTSCFHSFLIGFNLFLPHSSLSTLPSQRCT